MSIATSVSGLIDISNEAAEGLAGGFAYRNLEEDGDLVSEGTIGVLNETRPGTIGDDVYKQIFWSEQIGGTIQVNIPDLNYNEKLEPEVPGQGVAISIDLEANSRVDGSSEIFVTDLGLI